MRPVLELELELKPTEHCIDLIALPIDNSVILAIQDQQTDTTKLLHLDISKQIHKPISLPQKPIIQNYVKAFPPVLSSHSMSFIDAKQTNSSSVLLLLVQSTECSLYSQISTEQPQRILQFFVDIQKDGLIEQAELSNTSSCE